MHLSLTIALQGVREVLPDAVATLAYGPRAVPAEDPGARPTTGVSTARHAGASAPWPAPERFHV